MLRCVNRSLSDFGLCSALRLYQTSQSPLVLEAKQGKADGAVIFLHGLGDTCDGWRDVADMLQNNQPSVRWILPTAPTQFVTLNQCKMPSWYDITSLTDRSSNQCEGIEESRKTLESLIQGEIDKGISPGRIVVGGFSQGAAVTLHTAIQYRGLLGGIIALSGYLPKQIPSSQRLNTMTPFIQCHGRDDPVVPFELAKETFKTLEGEYGIPGVFHPYKNMGHELCPAEFADVLNFLLNRLGGSL